MLSRRSLSVAFATAFVLAAIGAPAAQADSFCYGQPATITGDGTVNGTSGNDVIVTGDGDDVIDGGGGQDLICAGGGNDQVVNLDGPGSLLAGGDGDDLIAGGPGDDTIDGGRGTDDCFGQGGTDHIYGCTNPTQFVVGQSAPDLVSRTGFDNRFRLADLTLQGQNVMIDFSALWCPPSSVMLPEVANTQASLRKAKVPFTYVVGELQDQAVHTSTRRTAEQTSERWGLSQLPVLHAEGSTFSGLFTAFGEFSAENNAYDDQNFNEFFPTQVFVNKQGVVTEVHVGLLAGQDILDRYKPGLTAASPVSASPAPLAGVDIENLRSMLDPLTISASSKATLQNQLTQALRAMELWLKPKTSACDWMKLFDATLKKTPGIGPADRADLVAGSNNIKTKLGCK